MILIIVLCVAVGITGVSEKLMQEILREKPTVQSEAEVSAGGY